MTASNQDHASQNRPSKDRPHGPHEILQHGAEFDADAAKRRHDDVQAHETHTAATDALIARSRALRATLQELHRVPSGAPDGLLAFRQAFQEHYAAKQATVHPLLERQDKASVAVVRDREDGAQLLRRLDDVIAGKVAVEGMTLTTQLVLGEVDQYLLHEERDLVPWMQRSL
ncbi:hypothetical protein [Streptomyces sp. H39-S7]|uniref:hypothetical protein n=1 Tax=Streptomyces sp. H39-S7 TaxID=3004357 RepID=UPI0022AF6094|nr:hypothetical protein [Streptomyces sp. H39-S7]MCZ4121977.1 hypothetical protein [Streptomyces sp. H39-S7]